MGISSLTTFVTPELVGDKLPEIMKPGENTATYLKEMQKQHPVPEVHYEKLSELEKSDILIFRDEKLQTIVPVPGDEISLRNYFSEDGEAMARLSQPATTDTLIFMVPDTFFQLPTHEITRIEGLLEANDAGIETGLPQEINKELYRYLPETGGEWSGEKGNSDWIPDDDVIPKQHNPEGKSWAEIKEALGFNEIPFRDGEPDFSDVTVETVEIDDFSVDRHANFTQADEACARKWTAENKDGKEWTPDDVRAYRKENNLSWHERSDMGTMDLVPSVVHGNIPHSGGISAAKRGA